jgi:hypothetical protein
LVVSRLQCPQCEIGVEGEFALPSLARLSPQDQIFVQAFLRHHGSIKKMESLFGVSYPTVKNRLNSISGQLDSSFAAPSENLEILDRLSRGEITVEEALESLS